MASNWRSRAPPSVTFPSSRAVAAHKTDLGGVKLGIEDPDALIDAYREMSSRLSASVVVQEMAQPGVEMALGIVHDPRFGPLVMVAAGGVLIETLGDRRLAMPPLNEARAMRLIDRLAAHPLLDGVRGAPPANAGSLALAMSRLSSLAWDLGDLIGALDINPLIVGPNGCVAVDALVETSAISQETQAERCLLGDYRNCLGVRSGA